MAFACGSVKSNGAIPLIILSFPFRTDSNCSLLSLALPTAITSSILSCALTNPSRICARASALSNSNCALLSITNSLCSTYVCNIFGSVSNTGLPSNIPIILAEYDSCKRLFLYN